jgi:hypothetical protein
VSGSHRAPDSHRRAPKHAPSWEEQAAADRAAGRAERVPPPRLAPKRARRPPWYRSPRNQLLVGGAAIALAVLARALVPAGGSEDPGPPLGEGLSHYGGDWQTKDGSKYRITVTPLVTFSSRASRDGCVPAPADGFVNARFAVRVQNLSGRTAPVPVVDFGVNLDASGSADPTKVEMPSVRTNVSLVPCADGATCDSASSIGPGGRSKLKKSEALDLVGTVGGISIPVEPGLSMIVRYRGSGGDTELLAPFPAFPVGS